MSREQSNIILPKAIILTQEVYPINCSRERLSGSVRCHIEYQILWLAKRDAIKLNKKPDVDKAVQRPADSGTRDAIQPNDGIHLTTQVKRPCIMSLCPKNKRDCQCPKQCHEKLKLYTMPKDFKMQSTATNIKEFIARDKGVYSSAKFEEAYTKSKLSDNLSNLVPTEHHKALNLALKTVTIMTEEAEMYTNNNQAFRVVSTSLNDMYAQSIRSIPNLSLDSAKVTVVSSSKRTEDAVNTASKGINSHDDIVAWTSNSTQREALHTDNVALYTTFLYLKYAEYQVDIDITPEKNIYTTNVSTIGSAHKQASKQTNKQGTQNKVHTCTHKKEIDAFTPQVDTTSQQEDDFANEYVEYIFKELAHTGRTPSNTTRKEATVDVNASVDALIKPIGDGKCVIQNNETKSGKEIQCVVVNNTVTSANNLDNKETKYTLNIDDESDNSPIHATCKQFKDVADETLLDIPMHKENTAYVSIYTTPQVTENMVHAAINAINTDYLDETQVEFNNKSIPNKNNVDASVKEMSKLDENDAILAMMHKQVEHMANNSMPEHDAENVAVNITVKHAGSPVNVIVRRKRKKIHYKPYKSINQPVYRAKHRMHAANNTKPKLLFNVDNNSEINNTNDGTRFAVNDTKQVVRAENLKSHIKKNASEHDMNKSFNNPPNNAENNSNEVATFNVHTFTALDRAINFRFKLITKLSNIAFHIMHETALDNTTVSSSITYEQIEVDAHAIIKILIKNAEDNLHALHNATLNQAMDMLLVLIKVLDKPKTTDNVKNNSKEASAVTVWPSYAVRVAISFISKLITNILYFAFKIRHDTASEAVGLSRSTTYKEIEDSAHSVMNFLLRNAENNAHAGLQRNTQNPAKDILQKLINTIYVQRTYIEDVGDVDAAAAEIDVSSVRYLEKEERTVFYDDDEDGGGILRIYAHSDIHTIVTTDQVNAMAADVQNGRTWTEIDNVRCSDQIETIYCC